MNTGRYKRGFGPKEIDNAPAAVNLPRCNQCGRVGGICSRPVMLDYSPRVPRQNVFHKNICVHCGTIQQWANGPAIYVFHSKSHRPIAQYIEFLLPLELYQSDGKADVALKVRMVAAMVRLQLKDPTEYIFTLEQVVKEMKNEK